MSRVANVLHFCTTFHFDFNFLTSSFTDLFYFCLKITNYFLMLQVGAHIYAKATFIVFIIVLLVLASIFISFFTVGPREIVLPPSAVANSTTQAVANYTGIRLHTLKSNLLRKCQMCSQQCCGLTVYPLQSMSTSRM